ncbi:MAG: hypothetical protein J7513_15015 [Solirubrobacteraceae bacterium]|nr:hypothetical protein [Solirubrobacteraceae bacterium]
MSAAFHQARQAARRWFDPTLALAIATLGTYEALSEHPRGGIAPNVAIAAAFGALVLQRRSWSGPALGAGWAAVAVLQSAVFATTDQASVGWLTFVLVVFAVGRYAPRRPALIGLGLMVVGMEGVYLCAPSHIAGDLFFPQVIGCVIWLAGRTLRGRARMTEQLHELAAQAQERVAAEAAQAQAAERRRLAQEMHDVIAHSLSVIVVQAGGARRILSTDPARAIEAAALIERTGREALGELRHLLGVLGPSLDASGSRRSAPTLDQLDGLIASARAAGLNAELTREDDGVPVPAGIDLAAYRILQEALTNALRHAGAVDVAVTVRSEAGSVALEVVNAAGTAGPASLGSSGHGLVGMTERAHLYHGSLEAGPIPGGGYRVAATLRAEREEAAA